MQEIANQTRERVYLALYGKYIFRGIAMPVFDRGRSVYAAVSISGLATHFTEEYIAEWAILLKKYINKIESRL